MFNENLNKPNKHQLCTHKNCTKEGLYKAPLTHGDAPVYTWLCLEHVREHNANWNYLAGYNENAIETFIKESTVWERPTWPLNAGPDRSFTYKASTKKRKPQSGNEKNAPSQPEHIKQAAKVLGITPPLTLSNTKESYRKLVKKYHPDSNNGKRTDIDKFHKLQHAFKTMRAYLQKKGSVKK